MINAKILLITLLSGSVPAFVTNEYAQYGFLSIALSILLFYSFQSYRSDKEDKKNREKERVETIDRYEEIIKERDRKFEEVMRAKNVQFEEMIKAKDLQFNDLLSTVLDRGLKDDV